MSGRLKNHTLKGGTSPYSLSMGVPPPPGSTLPDDTKISLVQCLIELILIYGSETWKPTSKNQKLSIGWKLYKPPP